MYTPRGSSQPRDESNAKSTSSKIDVCMDWDFPVNRSVSFVLGDRVEVLPDDENVVYPGIKHYKPDDGRMTIDYDNSSIESKVMATVRRNYSEPHGVNSGTLPCCSDGLHVTNTEQALLFSNLEQFVAESS